MSQEIVVELLPEEVVRMLAGRREFRDCRVIGPLGVGPLSRLFRCTVPGNPAPMALKFCMTRDRRPDIYQARMQYTALKRLERFGMEHGEHIRVVRALDLIEEHACLVMEWIKGRSMAELLSSPMTSEAEIAFWSRASGRWLKDFHAMRRLADRPTNCGVMLAQLDEEMNDTPMLRTNHSFAHGDEILRHFAPRIASIAVPVAQHHGDFKAENLMIASGQLVGFDIAADWEDAVTLDLAKFVRDIAFRSWRPAGWMLGRRYDAIIAGFLAGYGWDDANGPLLLWVRLHGLLRFWIALEAAPLDPIRESYGRYRFEQLVTEVADTLRASLA